MSKRFSINHKQKKKLKIKRGYDVNKKKVSTKYIGNSLVNVTTRRTQTKKIHEFTKI